MSVVIGTQFQGLPAASLAVADRQAVRAGQMQPMVEDLHLTRASRLRSLWSRGYAVSTSSGSLQTLQSEIVLRLSEAMVSTGELGVVIQGERIEVKISVTDGVNTMTATATQSAAGTAIATATGTGAPLASGAVVRMLVEYRATSGTGTLNAVLVREEDLTAGDL